jgi:aminoglycoside phosphotransferase (APT) family kinase protein
MTETSTDTAAVNLHTWTQYFQARLPGRKDLEVIDATRAVGGMARETWFISTSHEAAGETRAETFTVRTDHSDGPDMAVPLRYEYDVYRALADSPVPVPPALWFENDNAVLGRPFYVRQMIDGKSAPRDLFAPGQERMREDLGRQLAQQLADIHTLDPNAHGLDRFMTVPATPDDCAIVELDRWERYYYEHRVEAQPIMSEIFAWLRAHRPRSVDRISLVWGDVGLGNFIVRDAKIVGLTDWEYAHLDDPMKDWAAGFMRGIDQLLPRGDLFAIYEEKSGISIDEARIHYHSVFLNAQYALLTQPTVQQILGRNGSADISVVQANLGFSIGCQQEALRLIDM